MVRYKKMEDVVPGLLKKIQSEFQAAVDKNKKIKGIAVALQNGSATYIEANEYAIEVGEILADVYKRHLSATTLPDGKMYYNIAERIITSTMENLHKMISAIAKETQMQLNESAGIGMKAVVPTFNKDKVKGIINKVCNAENYKDVEWVLIAPVITFAQSIIDDAIRENAEFQGESGMKPQIVRTSSSKCCDWCAEIAGTYTYPDVPKDVYRRHGNCKCMVNYDPKNGKVQNVWSKKWKNREESDIIKARKSVGIPINDNAITKNIREKTIPFQNVDTVVERQKIHRNGTPLYEERQKMLKSRGQYGPSYITISDNEVLELVNQYSGKGQLKYNKHGQWNAQEVITTNDKPIGIVVDNRTGKTAETSVFKIHYGKDGIHIVPDYPSKKRR